MITSTFQEMLRTFLCFKINYSKNMSTLKYDEGSLYAHLEAIKLRGNDFSGIR